MVACITDDGEGLKTFNVQDGLGLKVDAKNLVLDFAIVTGRTSGVVAARAADLEITCLSRCWQ